MHCCAASADVSSERQWTAVLLPLMFLQNAAVSLQYLLNVAVHDVTLNLLLRDQNHVLNGTLSRQVTLPYVHRVSAYNVRT